MFAYNGCNDEEGREGTHLRLLKSPVHRGLLISLEGIDQAGKKTQARLLKERLRKAGYESKIVSFPDYSTPIGREIKAFLDGKRAYSARIRQLLFVANRFEWKPVIEGWIRDGFIVITDRYIPSGLAYGLANELTLDWMVKLEKGLPEPNVVIVIDVSLETAFSRKRGRDAYEKDAVFLEKVRNAYLELSKIFKWHIVNGERSIEEVSDEVWSIVSEIIEEHNVRPYQAS